MKKNILIIGTMSAFIFMGCGSDNTTSNPVKLGDKLYHDKSLSKDKTMACATCHELDHGLIDPRPTNLSLGASLGDDLVSIADRNAPTASYAQFIPEFHFDEEEGLFIGGQFLDGRATNLKAQAKQPFLNPVEMNMPNEESVVARVQENASYVLSLKKIYGEDIFASTEKAYDAIADTIAQFEKSEKFAPFSSKFDKVMKGEATFTEAENRGFALFNGKAQCNACHPAEGTNAHFTDFSYDNLGVPVNHALRDANGVGSGFVDVGLYGNIAVNDKDLKGAFRVSTLRNIAVTAPYMHNGLFKDLATVIHFYNTRDVKGAMNPETGAGWEKGEVEATKNDEELGNLGLSAEDEADIVAFLRTLTDEKYEHLMP
ncbi:Cytochrome c551 peroxidase [hydrothermal vent metagenome]|uniref:Cytochrome c551 peroxidase n=1 Tax=hydrothermal vent metagenome TaxID=652676 RepID=A0A1W1BXL1_9ZZZZ